MALVVLVVFVAAIVAWAAGGRWSAFSHPLLRAPGYVVIAVVAQVLGAALAGHVGGSWVYPTGLAISAASALIFCVANIRVSGVALVTLGLILNAVVVARNGSMPVSIAAASRADVSTLTIATGNDPRHEIAGYGSVWRGLGDVIPLPLPVLAEVVSPGDVLIAAGLAEFVVVSARRRKRDDDSQPSAWDGQAAQAL